MPETTREATAPVLFTVYCDDCKLKTDPRSREDALPFASRHRLQKHAVWHSKSTDDLAHMDELHAQSAEAHDPASSVPAPVHFRDYATEESSKSLG